MTLRLYFVNLSLGTSDPGSDNLVADSYVSQWDDRKLEIQGLLADTEEQTVSTPLALLISSSMWKSPDVGTFLTVRPFPSS